MSEELARYREVQKQFAEFRVPEADIQWRAGPTTRDKKKAQALVFAEPRVYQAALDDICPGEWSADFAPWGDSKIICRLTVCGNTRASTGEFDPSDGSAVAKGTAAEAQAFKRACVMHGLMRYFYEVPAPWVELDENKRFVKTPPMPAKYLPRVQNSRQRTPAPTPVEASALATPEQIEKINQLAEAKGYSYAQVVKVAQTLQKGVSQFSDLTGANAANIIARLEGAVAK